MVKSQTRVEQMLRNLVDQNSSIGGCIEPSIDSKSSEEELTLSPNEQRVMRQRTTKITAGLRSKVRSLAQRAIISMKSTTEEQDR